MRCVVLSALAVAVGWTASAQTVADSLRLAYTGTVTRYDTLADAQAGTNALASASLGSESRDFSLSFHQTGEVGDSLLLGTAWYPTLTGPTYGVGNPSNTNTGFVQIFDPTLGSLGSASSAWDAARTTFTLNLSGTNALDGTHPVYNTRLWNTTGDTGQGGTFLNYDFSLTASGLDVAQWDAGLGMYISESDPTAVVGSFTGLFQNTSEVAGAIGTSQQGFYTFDFTLNLDSWVYANASGFAPSAGMPNNEYGVSRLGSAIPEPSTYALVLGLGTLVMAGVRRWRQQR